MEPDFRAVHLRFRRNMVFCGVPLDATIPLDATRGIEERRAVEANDEGATEAGTIRCRRSYG